MNDLKHSARAVQDALDRAGLRCRVVELPDSTRTARQAAEAIGCGLAQIAKSIVFRGVETDRAVLVIASGENRVDEAAVAAHVGETVAKASAAFVRDSTGFAIGGVPPCGHSGELQIFIDRDLLRLSELWAAAGTPNAVFPLTPDQLLQLTGGEIIDIG